MASEVAKAPKMEAEAPEMAVEMAAEAPTAPEMGVRWE